MSTAARELAVRLAARIVVAALVLAATLQFLALPREGRENVWSTASLCTQPVRAER